MSGAAPGPRSTPATGYAATDTARDGRTLTIGALRPDDGDALLAAVGRMSAEALDLRLFAPRRSFSEAEIDRYANVDFVEPVALVALVEQAGAPMLAVFARSGLPIAQSRHDGVVHVRLTLAAGAE